MPARLCALIVEDEPLIALDLQEVMLALGFYVCGVARTQERARSLADSEPPRCRSDGRFPGGRPGRHRSSPMATRGLCGRK
jgi:hypothetical protein